MSEFIEENVVGVCILFFEKVKNKVKYWYEIM